MTKCSCEHSSTVGIYGQSLFSLQIKSERLPKTSQIYILDAFKIINILVHNQSTLVVNG